MPMQRMILTFGLILALAGSCNSSHKVGDGGTLRGEKPYSGTDKMSDAISTEPTAVTSDNVEAPILVAEQSEPASNAPAPAVEAEMEEDETNNKTAMEPVPIGGAYLTCRYQDGQKHGSETYRMDCAVAPLVEVMVPIVSAAFFKVDAQGNRSALTIISQDLLALNWVVQENLGSLASSQVQVVLSVPGLLSTTLTSAVDNSINLVQMPLFWLAGEPNSLTPEEDCVDFVPLSGQVSHKNFTGLTSGPLGRMNDISCSTIYNFLCRKISAGADAPKWRVSTITGPFANGATACSQGYAFSFPFNETEMNEVIALVDRLDIKLWINMSDSTSEGVFQARFR
jgi:hypothetical protein